MDNNQDETLLTSTTTTERPHRSIYYGEIIPRDNSNSSNTTNNETGFLGLDTTHILIIFLIVVFVVLILFLLLYHFVIKPMRQKVVSRMAQKSASGSIADEKSRNIFAHPERQLAVDQSTRINPNSPTSGSEVTEQQQTPIGIGSINNSINQQIPTTNSSNQQTNSAKSETEKSNSLGKKERVRQISFNSDNSTGNNNNNRQNNLITAFAGARDILKESVQKSK